MSRTDALPAEERTPLTRSYRLFTEGEQPFVDRLAIIMEVFKEMEDDNERTAVLRYVTDYYGFRIYKL